MKPLGFPGVLEINLADSFVIMNGDRYLEKNAMLQTEQYNESRAL